MSFQLNDVSPTAHWKGKQTKDIWYCSLCVSIYESYSPPGKTSALILLKRLSSSYSFASYGTYTAYAPADSTNCT